MSIKQALLHHTLNDELYTPEYAIIPLLQYLPKNAVIWECTDYGESNITKVLLNAGYKVINTHLSNFDFLKDKPNFDFDIICTNPPYSIKDKFIKKCYEYNKPFCLLLPITALEGKERSLLYQKKRIATSSF